MSWKWISFIMTEHESLEAAEAAIAAHMRNTGYSVSRARSKTEGRTRKIWLKCAHGGAHVDKPYLQSKERKRRSSTRLLSCNWSSIITRRTGTNIWVTQIEHSEHNHSPSTEGLPIMSSSICYSTRHSSEYDSGRSKSPGHSGTPEEPRPKLSRYFSRHL